MSPLTFIRRLRPGTILRSNRKPNRGTLFFRGNVCLVLSVTVGDSGISVHVLSEDGGLRREFTGVTFLNEPLDVDIL